MANDFVKKDGGPAKVPPKMEPPKSAFGNRQIVGLAKRMMGRLTSRDILDASTIKGALELILKNEVSLIILDRDLGGNKGAEEILMGILQVCPKKADFVVIYSGDAHMISPDVKEFLGEERIFMKGSDSEYRALLELVKHVEAGGTLREWLKPFC
ncbi:hypothetical protein JW721_01435 [Candidatus Micrarchaeota archaeon]|nr:hypothetical protein [Candidatus Micrarchaeota archaeon]